MGCTAAVAAESKLKIPLPAEEVNSYIDQLPVLALNKLKERYWSLTQSSQGILTLDNFVRLYSPDKLSAEEATALFSFFSDGKETGITCKQFIVKYCTLTKCQTPLFLKILFEIFKESNETSTMSEIAYNKFLKTHAQYYETAVDFRHFPITVQRFIDILMRSQFKVKEFQAKLNLITEAELPFAQIGKELIDSDFNDVVSGSSYYLLSNQWYYRWSFYYQDVNHMLDRQNIKSTKMLIEEKLNSIKKRKKKETRQTSSSSNSIGYKGEITTQVIQQPEFIDFEDIEGEYREELKENLKISSQIKIVNDKLWSLLVSLHPSEVSFKRLAIKKDTLDYYPKSIYFSEADDLGNIIVQSQVIKQISDSERIGNLVAYSTQKKYILYKLFNEQPWKETSFNRMIFELTTQPRCFVVVTASKDEFMAKHSRKEINLENIDLGDKVYAFLPLTKTIQEAIVIGVAKDDRVRVHFKGFSYRHELNLGKDQIWLNQAEGIFSCAQKRRETIVPILSNLMDDGFMNIVMQCLIATPVLGNYLTNHQFNEISQPVAYCLSQFTRFLLQKEPIDLPYVKQILTMNLTIPNHVNIGSFFEAILDKINSELSEKLSIIDYLFRFDEKVVTTCNECKQKVQNFDDAYMLALKAPESPIKFYSIIVLPIAAFAAKKVVIKMGVEDTVNDFLSQFEDAVSSNRKNYTFFSINGGQSVVNNEITLFGNQRKKIVQLGIAPTISLYALQKISQKFYFELLAGKGANHPYKDYLISSKNISTICKTTDFKEYKESISLEYLQPSGEHQFAKIEKKKSTDLVYELGSKSSTLLTNKKLILRRYDSTLRQMMQFGVQMFVGIPIWASYNDVQMLVKKSIRKMVREADNPYQLSQKTAFFLRLQDESDKICIFCQQIFTNSNLSQPAVCCNVYDKSTPISWLTRSKSFEIYVQWTNVEKVNLAYFEQIELDSLSKDILLASEEQEVTIDEYIKTYRQSFRIETPCEKCQSNNQRVEREISQMSNIIILSLDQSQMNGSRKLGLRLRWPEYMDSSKISIKAKGRIYELFAAVRNTTTSMGNFYTCSTKRKHPLKNKKNWFSFDDDIVQVESGEMKFIDDPCLLFFKKVDMPTSSRVIFKP